ncbi:MAG: 3-hydroxypropanoate dehydrogenase RulE [Saliniramus fredricksonii]|uniref:Putative NADH dehydrogenase/NAD(P)H nitroreductase GA0071312_1592 n=1 Tax=Saliniramus fredricksonii TaxID=1653334 RepID=A0A0N8KE17_9HYPH|nr:malonic semialdehyde reductase [Saliniramus fredricksonii]KPQ10090.1 MAG: 3-hydroxypropanoate dehydrogenase RulE [Saliniramus fredricksonii]SCC80608.1 3-hydroxypropanoate dehydrogenase [Saliniramus fredricksonii]
MTQSDSRPAGHGQPVPDQILDQLFREARTYYKWQDKPVSEATLRALFDLVKMGPTSANCSPARLIFVTSPEAKAKLKPHLMEGNVEKTMSAPVTAIIGYDLEFYEHYGFLHPHNPDAPRSWVEGKPDAIQKTAFQNGTLQGGYLIMAARALGLDCGPMAGFDNAGVEKAFFPDGKIKANFLCNLGYGDPDSLFPRLPRFAFEDVCAIA